MMKPFSFIDEATAAERKKSKELNIIFLSITGVVYSSRNMNADSEHAKRIQDPNFDPLNDPEIQAKIAIPGLLPKLNRYDISALLSFSKEAVANLCTLCEEFNAKIVISSNWRFKEGISVFWDIEELKALFSIPGFGQHIIGATPSLRSTMGSATRASEIEAWLLAHHNQVNSFIIIDACKQDTPKLFPNRFIYCKHDLLSDEALFQLAKTKLSTSCHHYTSNIVLQWRAFTCNSKKISKIALNPEKIFILKFSLGFKNTSELFDVLFPILRDNPYIREFELTGLRHKDETDLLVSKMTQWLKHPNMKLTKLNLSSNSIKNLMPILSCINGQNTTIRDLSFNANPITDCEELPSWLEKFTKPIQLNLNSKGNGYGDCYGKIDDDVLVTICRNKNVKLYANAAQLTLLHNFGITLNPNVLKLFDEGRLQLENFEQSVNDTGRSMAEFFGSIPRSILLRQIALYSAYSITEETTLSSSSTDKTGITLLSPS